MAVNLKEKREAIHLSQRQLAEEIGIQRSTIAMIETGVNLPSVPVAQRLGRLLGFDWTEFFEDGDENVANG